MFEPVRAFFGGLAGGIRADANPLDERYWSTGTVYQTATGLTVGPVEAFQVSCIFQGVRLYAETRLLFNQLMQNATPQEASDADVRAVFEVFEATGAMQPGLTYEQFRTQVSPEAIQTLGRAVAVKKDVQTQLDQLDVRVNPRFEQSEIAVYTEPGPQNEPLSLVAVPLADTDTSPVTAICSNQTTKSTRWTHSSTSWVSDH